MFPVFIWRVGWTITREQRPVSWISNWFASLLKSPAESQDQKPVTKNSRYLSAASGVFWGQQGPQASLSTHSQFHLTVCSGVAGALISLSCHWTQITIKWWSAHNSDLPFTQVSDGTTTKPSVNDQGGQVPGILNHFMLQHDALLFQHVFKHSCCIVLLSNTKRAVGKNICCTWCWGVN